MIRIIPVLLLSFALAVPAWSQESSTVPSQPCWADAFPNMTQARGGNEITCEICTTIFQGLDDYLLENEDQVNEMETGILRIRYGLDITLQFSDCPCVRKLVRGISLAL